MGWVFYSFKLGIKSGPGSAIIYYSKVRLQEQIQSCRYAISMKIDFYQSQLKFLNSEKENNNYKKGKYCAHSSHRAPLDLCPEGLLRT